ncbi:MAG: ABC transporter ATP-binding protein [Gammaproteobacteria bacterium]|nr:ABC transporter ATP-binding protein [Gammaproteobacteria bacterium]
MSALSLERVSVALNKKTIVREASLTVRQGEILALIGPNGAGKSTLLKAIAHLLPFRGAIRWDDDELRRLSARQRARRVAYLGQGQQGFWAITVAELVALGRYPHQSRWWGLSANDRQAVERVLAQTGLTSLAGRPFDRLSGGEKARALLARALAVDAPVLLADEPIVSLDPHHQLRMMDLLRRHAEQGHAVITVLHDLTLASRFCRRLALLHRGAIVAAGDVAEVLTPDHLRDIYGISALCGEHQRQDYVLPWRYHTAGAAERDGRAQPLAADPAPGWMEKP